MKATKKKVDWRVLCTGLVCISILEAYALYQGIDGTIFTIVLAIMAGAIGIIVPSPIETI